MSGTLRPVRRSTLPPSPKLVIESPVSALIAVIMPALR